jgi:hypothetical protein
MDCIQTHKAVKQLTAKTQITQRFKIQFESNSSETTHQSFSVFFAPLRLKKQTEKTQKTQSSIRNAFASKTLEVLNSSLRSLRLCG